MSVELPEAFILSSQLNEILPGKTIRSYLLQNYERLQKVGFMNKDLDAFDGLIEKKIRKITSRGMVIRMELNKGMNLLLSPEYGGQVQFHKTPDTLPKKFHLKLDFADNCLLTTRLTGMGLIYAASDDALAKVYVYRRDFLQGKSPLEEDFTLDYFSKALGEKKRMLKTVMIGKEAALIGLGNSAFQEIVYKAGIHPKRKASELSNAEKTTLYAALREIIDSRVHLGGKNEFKDLYGKQGAHTPIIGPHMRDKSCPQCGTTIEKLQIAGGPTYYCPTCQKMPS